MRNQHMVVTACLLMWFAHEASGQDATIRKGPEQSPAPGNGSAIYPRRSGVDLYIDRLEQQWRGEQQQKQEALRREKERQRQATEEALRRQREQDQLSRDPIHQAKLRKEATDRARRRADDAQRSVDQSVPLRGTLQAVSGGGDGAGPGQLDEAPPSLLSNEELVREFLSASSPEGAPERVISVERSRWEARRDGLFAELRARGIDMSAELRAGRVDMSTASREQPIEPSAQQGAPGVPGGLTAQDAKGPPDKGEGKAGRNAAGPGVPKGNSAEGRVKQAIFHELEQRKIPYATEVEFFVLDKDGKPVLDPKTKKPLVGRMDVVYLDPADGNGKVVFIEAKGGPDSSLTRGQAQYHPLLDSGAEWEIKGHKASTLGLEPGVRKSSLAKEGFKVVHSVNLDDFRRSVEHVTPVQRYSYRRITPAGKLEAKYFDNVDDYHKYLESIGMTPIRPAAIRAAGGVAGAAKWAGKKVVKSIPILGFFYTLFGPGDASAGQRVGSALLGEVGIGPFDLDMILGWLIGDTPQVPREQWMREQHRVTPSVK